MLFNNDKMREKWGEKRYFKQAIILTINNTYNLITKLMTIEQALSKYYSKEIAKGERMIRIYDFLEYNYKVRYVDLCFRCNIKPKSFAKWLLMDISVLM